MSPKRNIRHKILIFFSPLIFLAIDLKTLARFLQCLLHLINLEHFMGGFTHSSTRAWRVYEHLHAHKHAHLCAHNHPHSHTLTRTHVHSVSFSPTHAHTHTHAQTQKHIERYTHTLCIHIHTHVFSLSLSVARSPFVARSLSHAPAHSSLSYTRNTYIHIDAVQRLTRRRRTSALLSLANLDACRSFLFQKVSTLAISDISLFHSPRLASQIF